ncbi:MAG: hypothetical protein GF392_01205 [Candidatus Omnitrophica bacterium]|nr:hypothetical protein [Candidatus Omnitrophota bacterium]
MMFKKFKERKNGLTTVVSPMPGMTSVSLGIWIGAGGRDEDSVQSGISHLIEHMLFKGTSTRSVKDLKRAVEGVGGMFNGFTSDEVTCYMVKVPVKYLELGMDVLTDMVIDPRFDETDLKKEKFVVGEEIKMYRDQPSEHVLELLAELMWPDHPLGRPLTGNISTVRSMKRQDLIKYKEKFYTPGNISVVAAGNVDPGTVRQLARERFRHCSRGENVRDRSLRDSPRGPRLRVKHDDIQQTHIALGFRSDISDIKERFATKIMNLILGGNMSSRLFEQLREKHGLCYDISSSYKRHSDVGELQVHVGVDTRKTVRAINAVLDEIKKLKDEGVTGEELQRAKRYAEGQFSLAIENTSARMMWLGDRLMVHNRIPDMKEVIRRLEAVTVTDIRKACERTFTSDLLNLALIGKVRPSDRKAIKRRLAGI